MSHFDDRVVILCVRHDGRSLDLALTTDEIRAVIAGLRMEGASAGALLDSGRPLTDLEDHQARRRARAATTVLHALCTATRPSRDTPQVAAFRGATLRGQRISIPPGKASSSSGRSPIRVTVELENPWEAEADRRVDGASAPDAVSPRKGDSR